MTSSDDVIMINTDIDQSCLLLNVLLDTLYAINCAILMMSLSVFDNVCTFFMVCVVTYAGRYHSAIKGKERKSIYIVPLYSV